MDRIEWKETVVSYIKVMNIEAGLNGLNARNEHERAVASSKKWTLMLVLNKSRLNFFATNSCQYHASSPHLQWSPFWTLFPTPSFVYHGRTRTRRFLFSWNRDGYCIFGGNLTAVESHLIILEISKTRLSEIDITLRCLLSNMTV